MDWYSWLSNSSLEPYLVYEYGLLLTTNELEEEDIAYLDHSFLQSMGIAIAKHRLEILKLAHKDTSRVPPLAVAKLVAAFRQSKNCLARYLRTLSRATSPAILVVPPTPFGGDRWGGAMSRRKTKLALLRQGRLMITDRGMSIARLPSPSHGASPMFRGHLDRQPNAAAAADDDGYWETAAGDMRWDSMFHNLKPT
ncbi:hypothetical protein BHE74_00047261 [Ensete ventricosum]|nr:hypothetical protein BHE74_00047261 [Ensete ventricosum]